MQKNLRRPVYAVAALAAGAAIALTGCSDNSDDTETSAVTSAPSAAPGSPATDAEASAAAVEGLDVASAQEIFRAAVNPDTPTEELGRYVDVDGPELDGLANFNKGAARGGYTPDIYTVKSVAPGAESDEATVTVSVASPHAPAPVDVPYEFVNEDGVWKLSDDAVTAIMRSGER